MWEIQFWRNVLERAIKTAAQAALLAVGGSIANLFALDWAVLGGAAGGGALLSVLTSLGTEVLPFGNNGTASLSKAVKQTTPSAAETPPLS